MRNRNTALGVAVLGLMALLLAGCPQDPQVKKQQHFDRGSRQLEEGKYNEAIIELRNALQLDASFVPALYALGRAYYAKGWYVDAARELSRAAEREPGAIPIRIVLGQAFLALGDSNKAEEQAEAIRRVEPDNPVVKYLLGAAPARSGSGWRPDREG
jgi:tetratricopeptide (TPR) repeat protein